MATTPVKVINTPSTAVAHNDALPHVVDGQGNTLQSAGKAGTFVYTTGPSTTGDAGGSNSETSNPVKYPYVQGNPEEQYDIIVTRVGVAAYPNQSLPFALALGDEILDDFADFLPSIPNVGSNAPSSVLFVGGNLVFSYTNGENTDTVVVSCAQMSYANLIQRLQLKQYLMTTLRVALSDNSQLSQLSTGIRKGQRYEGGGTDSHPLSYRANYSGYQFTPIIDIGRNLYISRMKGIMGGIIGVNNFQVTYSTFVKSVGLIQKQAATN